MAIAKKTAKKQDGAPAWMVTYGDMVTLLLTFFVLLLAMSEVKKQEQFAEFMEAIRGAFGYVGGVRHVPTEEVNIPRNVPLSQMLVIPVHWEDFSKSPEPGIRGEQSQTRDNEPGHVFVVGGRLQFPSLSADLASDERARISQLARELRGLSTRLKVTGHCSRRPVDGTAFASHRDLAYQRACTVADALVAEGIDPQRIVVEVAGTNQPVARRAYTEPDRLQNDLVEVLQIDLHVDEPAP
jgi:chemotaxis protein MotB